MIESDYHDSLIFEHGMSAVSPRQLFGNLNNQLPIWYAGRALSTKQVAQILGLDDSTVRQQAQSGILKGRRGARGWLFGIRDVSDYIANGKWRGRQSVRRWTQEEFMEVITTGTCRGRSQEAVRLMKRKMRRRHQEQQTTPGSTPGFCWASAITPLPMEPSKHE